MRAYNAVGNSAYSNQVTLTTPGGPPGAFTLSNDPPVWDASIPGSKVQLNWTPSSDVGNYAVYRNSTVYTAGIVGTSYLNSAGLMGGNAYTYFIRASNADGTTDSNTVTVTMPTAPTSAPAIQSNTASSITSTSAVINGTVLNDGSSSIIDRRFDWGTSTPLNQAVYSAGITVSGNTFSATLTGLAPNTTYFFRAWARNGSVSDVGYGAGWNVGSILSFNTSSGVQPNLTPYQPSGWSDKIVVSSVTGNNTDSPSLTTANTIYVDWAVINNGASPATSRFYTEFMSMACSGPTGSPIHL